ncbi:MAG: TetR/AcrR family transcriptional regulator [Hyphomicrobiales bacterium]
MPPRDKVRELIIESARELFGRYGFKKTTMDEIAQYARKGKSSLYYYFKSKEEVFEAVVEEEVLSLKRTLKRKINPQDPAEKQLKDYVITRMMTIQKLANMYAILSNDHMINYDFMFHLREKYHKEEISAVELIMRQGVRSGRFREIESHFAAIAFVTAMKGLERPLFANKSPRSLHARAESLMNIMFYGLVKEEIKEKPAI